MALLSGYCACEAYLDRATVNQQTVQLLERLASAIGFTERDVGNTTALGVGAVGQFDPLDGADRLDKVFLLGTRVSEPKAWGCIFAANPTSRLVRSIQSKGPRELCGGMSPQTTQGASKTVSK